MSELLHLATIRKLIPWAGIKGPTERDILLQLIQLAGDLCVLAVPYLCVGTTCLNSPAKYKDMWWGSGCLVLQSNFSLCFSCACKLDTLYASSNLYSSASFQPHCRNQIHTIFSKASKLLTGATSRLCHIPLAICPKLLGQSQGMMLTHRCST